MLKGESKPKRAKKEEVVQTYCFQCNFGPDPIIARRVKGAVVSIEGNARFKANHPSQGAICPRAFGLKQKLYNPHRVKAPMKRTNPQKGRGIDPKWIEMSWEEALDTVAKKLEEIKLKGPVDEKGLPKVAVTQGSGGVPAVLGGTWEAFWKAWGPVDRSLGCGAGTKCYHSEHLYGEFWHKAWLCTPDHLLTKYLISFGHNFNASQGVAGSRKLADARTRGMKWVQVEPHLSVTGATANEWIPIRPMTDGALLLAIIHVILREYNWQQVCDVEFLKQRTNSCYLVGDSGYYLRHTVNKKPLIWDASVQQAKAFDDPTIKDFALDGVYSIGGLELGAEGKSKQHESVRVRPAFQLLIEHVDKYTPCWAADITGVSEAKIRSIAKDWIENANIGATIQIDGLELPYRPVAIALGKTVNNGWASSLCVWAVHVLAVLVGALEVPGSHLAQKDAYGGPIKPGEDGFPAVDIHPTNASEWQWPPNTRDAVSTLCPISDSFGPSHLSYKFLSHPPENWPRPSFPDIWFIYHANPMVSQSDPKLVEQVIERIPFLVCFAYVMDETNQFADILLPENTDLESLGITLVGSNKTTAGIYGEYMGWHLRQPVVKPTFNTMDITDIFSGLAEKLGILPEYNSAINSGKGSGIVLDGTNYELEARKKYSVEEIVDKQCRAVTKGKHGLKWFRQNGAVFKPYPRLKGWYHHIQMVEGGLRWELPYGERLKRIGEELKTRLHSVGIHWWDLQTESFRSMPDWIDFTAIYNEADSRCSKETQEYPFWLICYRTMLFSWAANADSPWMLEAGEKVPGIGKIAMNYQRAKDLDIAENDEVWVESTQGKIKCKVHLQKGIHPDVLAVAGQFGHYVMANIKDKQWPSMNSLLSISEELTDETGGEADRVKVSLCKAMG